MSIVHVNDFYCVAFAVLGEAPMSAFPPIGKGFHGLSVTNCALMVSRLLPLFGLKVAASVCNARNFR